MDVLSFSEPSTVVTGIPQTKWNGKKLTRYVPIIRQPTKLTAIIGKSKYVNTDPKGLKQLKRFIVFQANKARHEYKANRHKTRNSDLMLVYTKKGWRFVN